MFSRLKLNTKFTLLLSLVFATGILTSGFVLWRTLNERAQAEITSQGLILIEAMNAVRRYTSLNVSPRLAEAPAGEPLFLAETVPAFSAHTVFEYFRQHQGHDNFAYREAAPNPTNPAHRADELETELVARMQRDTSLKEIADFRELDGRRVFYIARPLAVTSESCLDCHGSPDQAPASLIATYGSEYGFGWELNEIVAAQIIYVPAEEVFNATLRSFSLVMAIFIVILALVVILINLLLRRYVIEPVMVMGGLAQKISADEMAAEDAESAEITSLAARRDELGYLARLFQKMARQVHARTELLKQQVMELRIEVDEIKRSKEVAAITGSDFFQELQAKARELRRNNRAEGDS
jgi:HAMP domain-containing protein